MAKKPTPATGGYIATRTINYDGVPHEAGEPFPGEGLRPPVAAEIQQLLDVGAIEAAQTEEKAS